MKLKLSDHFVVSAFEDHKEIKTNEFSAEKLIEAWPQMLTWMARKPSTRGIKVSKGKFNYSAKDVTTAIARFLVSNAAMAMG